MEAKFNASVRVSASAQAGLGPLDFKATVGDEVVFTEGSGAGQINKVCTSSRSLAASATESLDLAGGLTDPFGASLTFTQIKAIWIEADAGNTNNVVVGGAASNAWLGPFGDATDTITLKPGAQIMIVMPASQWAVTAGTGDLLKVANSAAGSAVKYRIVIVGI